MFLWIKSPVKAAPPVRRNRPMVEEEPSRKKKEGVSVKLGNITMSQGLLFGLLALALLAVLATVNQYQEEVTLSEVQVNILAASDNGFMNEGRVLEAMGWPGGVAPLGTRLDQLSLNLLEDSLKKHPFVKQAELYKSLQGALHIEVEMREPVARLMNNSGEDVYLDADGYKFPISPLHSSNVLLVRGDFEEAVADTFGCETVLACLPVLTYIHHHPYWNTYFSEVDLKGNGELILHPRRDNMIIEFGHPLRISEKLTNLKAFLTNIMSHEDRPRFKQISIKYKGQVVATKR